MMKIFRRMASYDNDIPFVQLWRRGIAVSVVLVLVSIGALVGRGLNLGIDFEGGTAWEVVAPDASVADVRAALADIGEDGAKIQTVGTDTIRVQSEPTSADAVAEVTDRLAELAGVESEDVSVSTVGPTWGDEISAKAQRALVIFFVVIALYIAWRLEWKMALGALAAVVHDIGISVGVYALFRLEVTPATVISFLTIMGYSLYDTIVVFDKVQENATKPAVAQKMTYTDMMSLSLNQVLMRSLNTTMTSILPVIAMLVVGSAILGAVTLQEFAIALLIGLISGAYSSIFVATPLVAWLKEREPQYRNIRARLEGQESRKPGEALAGARRSRAGRSGDASDGEPTSASAPAAGAPELSGRIIPPRPRKQGRRR